MIHCLAKNTIVGFTMLFYIIQRLIGIVEKGAFWVLPVREGGTDADAYGGKAGAAVCNGVAQQPQPFLQRFPEGFTHVNHNDRKFIAANAKCVILTAEYTF